MPEVPDMRVEDQKSGSLTSVLCASLAALRCAIVRPELARWAKEPENRPGSGWRPGVDCGSAGALERCMMVEEVRKGLRRKRARGGRLG